MGIIFERHDLVLAAGLRGREWLRCCCQWYRYVQMALVGWLLCGMQTLYVSCWSLFRDQLLSLSKIGTLILKLSFGLRWYERRLLVLGQDWLLDNLQKNNVVLRVFKRDRESVMHVMTAEMILTRFDKRKWIFEFRARTMTRAKNKWRGPLDTWWSTHMSPYRLALELP